MLGKEDPKPRSPFRKGNACILSFRGADFMSCIAAWQGRLARYFQIQIHIPVKSQRLVEIGCEFTLPLLARSGTAWQKDEDQSGLCGNLTLKTISFCIVKENCKRVYVSLDSPGMMGEAA